MDSFLQMLSSIKRIEGLAVADVYHKDDLRYAHHCLAQTKYLVVMWPKHPVKRVLILGTQEDVTDFSQRANDFPPGEYHEL